MSDRYGLILVKDLDKFRKTQLDDEGEPLNFIQYAVYRPYGLKEDFEDNVLYTPFQIRTDDVGIRLRNIINSAKRVDPNLDLPRIVKIKTVKKFLEDDLSYYIDMFGKCGEEPFLEEHFLKLVDMFGDTLELIKNNENEFPYALIGIH